MTTATDPAICKHCHRAHVGGWNPRHLFVPVDLAASRAATAERTRADRLREAVATLEKCGLLAYMDALHSEVAGLACVAAKGELSGLISRLSDGSDEPRYAAAMTARRALGALWEVL